MRDGRAFIAAGGIQSDGSTLGRGDGVLRSGRRRAALYADPQVDRANCGVCDNASLGSSTAYERLSLTAD